MQHGKHGRQLGSGRLKPNAFADFVTGQIADNNQPERTMKTPTPTTNARWEKLCCSGQSWYQIAEEMKLDCRQKERELTAARAEIEEYAEDKSRLATMAMEFREQRDRLAEALKEYREALSDGPENCSYKMYEAVDEFAEKALQSLTTNKEDQERKSPASDGSEIN
jgi:chromosome segregation ATPase